MHFAISTFRVLLTVQGCIQTLARPSSVVERCSLDVRQGTASAVIISTLDIYYYMSSVAVDILHQGNAKYCTLFSIYLIVANTYERALHPVDFCSSLVHPNSIVGNTYPWVPAKLEKIRTYASSARKEYHKTVMSFFIFEKELGY